MNWDCVRAAAEIHKGVVVYVPRGMRHKAVGKLTVLMSVFPVGASITSTKSSRCLRRHRSGHSVVAKV
jgi:hypothetical protein